MIKLIPTLFIATSMLVAKPVAAQYCQGTVVKNTTTGTFTDGSGSSNYADESDCKWLIAPPGAGSITLTFTGVFDLELYNCSDKITVYDGGDTTDNVLAVLCGNQSMTPPAPVTSSGGTMLVRFTSDYSYNNQGWSASYTSTVAPPVYCSGQNNLTAISGNFADGSGASNNYSDNSNCSWLINPPAGTTSITVSFSSFATEAGMDFVKIYDNSTSPASQVASFSGSSLPSPVTVNSGSVLVEFTSNNTTTAAGWDASYTSTQAPPTSMGCSGTTTLTAPMGTFDDGSGSSNYADNSDCEWVINPSSAASITLTFSAFDIQSGQDFVEVFDNSTTPPTILGSFSGSTIPGAVSLNGNNMLVTFTSNASVNSTGWAASYTSSNTPAGISEAVSDKNISIYPNPFHHTATLAFASPQNDASELLMFDVYGKQVMKFQISAQATSVVIDGSSLAAGMYYYNIVAKTGNAIHKGRLVVE